MTIHKVSAGDGYDYLTRQVARGDQDPVKGQDLAGYYTASGEPPGIWAGRGCRDLRVSGVVRDDQMQSLFGEGLHPDADILGPIPLGRAFPTYSKGATAYSKSYGAGLQLFREQHGRGASEPERKALRLTAARATLLDMGRPASARNPAAVAEFLAEQRRFERQAVAGYDLTFSPAKSVSTLWAVSGHEVRERIEEAHRQAWQESLAYLEREAAFTRTGAAGVAQIETHGLVAAAFDHRTSRSGDPDLHTHLVVSSKVLGVDGTWRSLDGRPLYAIGVTASEMYNARLEDALVSRLGVAFHDVERAVPGKRPVREIAGVSPKLMKAFSRRREAIETRYAELLRGYVAEHGRDPSRAIQASMSLYQQATLETREAKAPGVPLAQRVAQWTATADRLLGETGRERMLATVLGGTPRWDTRSLAEVSATVLQRVSEQRSTWKPQHVRAEAERQLRAHPLAVGAGRDAAVGEVERLVLGPGGMSVRLTMDAFAPLPAELVRSDGESVFRVHGQVLYTSRAVLDAEARLVAAGREPVAYGVAVDPVLLVGLTPGQAELVRHFAGVGTQLAVGVGAAGTGKSTAMGRLVTAWAVTGGKVIGLAPSADAAIKLGGEIGAPAQTIDRLLTLHQHGLLAADSVRAGDMLLVDETGKAGTGNLDRLRALAAERGAVLRLVGDQHQLGSAAAGGSFRLLAHELGAAEMLDVLRFHDPQEAAASLLLRAGGQGAAEFYVSHGRVHEGTTVDVADQVYRGWMADRLAGRSTIMMAASNAAVAGLNERAQAELRAAGVITGAATALREDQAAGVGDVVLARHNDRRVTVGHRGDWVRNGSLFTVTGVGADGSLTVQRVDGDAVTTLPVEYVRTWVDLGYASTIDRAEGVTVDTSRVIGHPGMTRQQLYVALSRGRAANHVHVEVEQHLDADVERAPDPRAEAQTVLRSIIARDGAEVSATETLRQEMDAPERLDRLVPEYEHAVQLLSPRDQEAQREVLRTLFGAPETDAILADPASDALRVELGRHADPVTALARAAGQRELGSAESVAQVLQWRLEGLRSHAAERALAGPLPWLPAVPDTSAGELHDWTAQRARAIEGRAAELAGRVDADRPVWASALGARPVEPEPARTWDRAAALAASYREQWQVTDDSSVLGAAPAGGTQLRAWTAADGAVREWAAARERNRGDLDLDLGSAKTDPAEQFTARPYSEMSDRLLARTIQGCRQQQVDAQRWTADAAAMATGRGLNVTVAEREVAQFSDEAAQVRAATAAREAADAVARAGGELRAKEAELATVGRFSGGKRKAITAEVQELRTIRDTRVAEHEAAVALVRPGPDPRYRGDPSEQAVAQRAEQVMAIAQQRDARRVETARWQAEDATAQAERSAPALADALAEQEYRERAGITVEEDPQVPARERLAAEQAERDDLDDDYSHDVAAAVEQDGIEY